MTFITVKLIVFRNRNVFFHFAPLCYFFTFVDLLTSSDENWSHIFSNEI